MILERETVVERERYGERKSLSEKGRVVGGGQELIAASSELCQEKWHGETMAARGRRKRGRESVCFGSQVAAHEWAI